MDNPSVSEWPPASIVIPTRSRPDYLAVTLASVTPQARAIGAEVVVVNDGQDPSTAALAERSGAALVSFGQPRGLNAARNAGVQAARSDLIVFVDDDVEAPPGWLGTLLEGVRSAPDREVFGGPIRARLEGGGPRSCGRESAPITTLDFGPEDRDVSLVWGANMAVRRAAFDRVGGFDERLAGRGDEEEWERRYTDLGGRIRYVAAAGLDHRRARSDATVRSLARADYTHGRNARRNDRRGRQAPPLRAELRTLIGCLWHIFRRRCANGIVMAAHTAGRIREALTESRAWGSP
jgi:GT2 family glycosyltransferase